MTLDEFKVATNEQLIDYGKTIPLGSTYDYNNNQLTYKTSYGHWYEYTYDTNRNLLTHKDSNGRWYEYTYDTNRNRLTHKDSYGNNFDLLCIGKEFNLVYEEEKQLYKAGCKKFDYKQCIELFDTEGDDYTDAKLFMDAIHKNELDLLK